MDLSEKRRESGRLSSTPSPPPHILISNRDSDNEKHAALPPLSVDIEGRLDATRSTDVPSLPEGCADTGCSKSDSMFKRLGLLDRFLAVWIFLAMLIGILLGNFVDNVGPALQKGKFVDVSIPIGMSLPPSLAHSVMLT
jgi:ACR3 family arsenite transporter